jgi:hypothetical protein
VIYDLFRFEDNLFRNEAEIFRNEPCTGIRQNSGFCINPYFIYIYSSILPFYTVIYIKLGYTIGRSINNR